MAVKRHLWKRHLCWIALAEAVGALSGWLTGDGMELYKTSMAKPPLSPPGIVFPIVWTILFALMGLGAARISMALASSERSRSLRLFFLQLAFNFVWSIIFFHFQRFGLAFLWLALLWLLILWMILAFQAVDPPAAWLQIPYLVWVAFAGYLNLGVWILNRP